MFKNNLPSAVLRLLGDKEMSQGGLAKKTGMSSRQINNIINKHSDSSISSLEKICVALNATPNDLLIPQSTKAKAEAKEINKLVHNLKSSSKEYTPICPHCGKPLNAEYSAYCDSCCGKLLWDKYTDAKIVEAEE